MKKILKIIVLLLICMLLICGISQYSFAASDYDLPVVTSIVLDKHQLKPGDTLTITMNVTDSSEISIDPDSDNKTFLYLKNGSSYTDLFYFTKKSNGVYTSVVTIPETYVNGYYFLSYLVVSDVQGNEYYTYSYSDFPSVYFEVIGASADESAPVVKDLEIDKHDAVPGDTVTITCEISDANELDLDMFNSYFYLKNDIYTSEPFIFQRIASGIYEATITIGSNYVNGRYQFSELALTDTCGNTYLNNDPSSFPEIYVNVSGASDDRSAPEVQAITIDKHEVQVGDSVTITSEIIDESEIEEDSIRHYLILKNGTFYSGMFLFEQIEGNTYAATLPITEDYYDGTYVPDYYIVSDIIGNKAVFYGPSDFPDVYFTVSGHSAVEYYHKPGWFLSGGIWYFNDAKGNRATGWLKRGNNWYYLNSAGEMQTGWVKVNNKWYYLTPSSGVMKTGWINDEGTWYYASESGALQFGWLLSNNKWYYLNGSGAMQTGWVHSKGKWYYTDLSSGAMITNRWINDKGKWYHVDSYGVMQIGWVKLNSKWYYLNGSGAMQTGWVHSKGKWYYTDLSSGAMITNNWINDQEKWYHVDSFGVMQFGWLKSNNKWYYLNSSGVMLNGWLPLGNQWYYLDLSSGAMQTGWVNIKDNWYYLNNSGVMQTDWIKLNNKWYYLKPTGRMADSEWVNGYWISKNGVWSYQPRGTWKKNQSGWWFGDTSGWYAKNETVRINDTDYEFDEKGYWIDPNKEVLTEEEPSDNPDSIDTENTQNRQFIN